MSRPCSVRWSPLVVVIPLALLAGACDDTVAPTAPATTVTETFTGALAKEQAVVHAFTVPKMGTVTLTLLSVVPVPETVDAIVLSLGIGTWNGTTCTLIAENANAGQGTFLSGTALAGSFCARIFDAGGTIPESVSYTLQVVRPE